jgi:hypothetical protein
MGTNRCSEACFYIYYRVLFEPIILLEEYRVVAQPSSIKDLHIVLNFLSYDPRVEAPEWRSKIFVEFVEFNPRNPTYGLMFWVQRVNSKLLTSLDFLYA